MPKSLRQSLAFLCCGLAIYNLLLFLAIMSRVVQETGELGPSAALMYLGLLASAISLGTCAYFCFFSIRMSIGASWLVWIGITWGLTGLAQSLYPWNLALAAGFLVLAMMTMRRLTGSSGSDSDSEMIQRTDRFYSAIRRGFYVIILACAVVPLVLHVSEDSRADLVAARYAGRLVLWFSSLFAMCGFHLWHALKDRRLRNVEQAKNEALASSVAVPFTIAVYVAVNGLVLGLLFGLYLDQYTLMAASVVFFVYNSR